jgi:hypothetical protein
VPISPNDLTHISRKLALPKGRLSSFQEILFQRIRRKYFLKKLEYSSEILDQNEELLKDIYLFLA